MAALRAAIIFFDFIYSYTWRQQYTQNIKMVAQNATIFMF
jgi:hypothetical protein